MFVFLLQLRDLVIGHRLHLFAIYMLLVWIVWTWKVVLSRRYRPFLVDHDPTTSVVIPVVDEPEDLFRDVIARIEGQSPDEILVVINGPRNLKLEAICEDFGTVTWTWTEVPGKRNAVRLGVERARGEIVVLVDSDTVWTDGTLAELLRPFAEPDVGGVSTRQRILEPERHVLTRWADWMENLRNLYSMPAMSVLGTVGCLPGRTIAFRRSVLADAMENFLGARFLGTFLEVSDDRTLTNECLKQGYRTVYQSTSLVYTDAPTSWRKTGRQQLRWARGSQYNTLRMMPWMIRRARPLGFFYACDIVLPFLLLGAYTGWFLRQFVTGEVDLYAEVVTTYGRIGGAATVGLLTILGTVASAALRQSRHLHDRPSDLVLIPTFLLISSLMLMPIRMLGFVRMARNSGWGTRAGGFEGEKRRNPKALIPPALAVSMLALFTLYQP